MIKLVVQLLIVQPCSNLFLIKSLAWFALTIVEYSPDLVKATFLPCVFRMTLTL